MGLYRSVASTAFIRHTCIPVPDDGAFFFFFSLARKSPTSPGIDASHLSRKRFLERDGEASTQVEYHETDSSQV